VSQLPDWHADFPRFEARRLTDVVPKLCAAGLDLLARLLDYDPARRITADQALQHAYFDGVDVPK